MKENNELNEKKWKRKKLFLIKVSFMIRKRVKSKKHKRKNELTEKERKKDNCIKKEKKIYFLSQG